jgi:predicted DNA repair protein MutK
VGGMTWWQIALIVFVGLPMTVMLYGLAALILKLARDEWRERR